MELRQITPRFFVSPQIDPADMAAIRSAGITHVLCNRPDAEVPASHSAAAIETAAKAAGLTFALRPLTHQSMVPDVIAENRRLGVGTDDVTLAYCASGTRSTIAWALGEAGRMPGDEIFAAAQQAGYDLTQVRPALDQPFV